jgi:hypothetical protein
MADAVDEHVRAMMAWHFDPGTGSPFWLDVAAELPFDPRRDVRTRADLALFPDLSERWRDVPVGDLVPRGLGAAELPVRVFESGGSTGRPKRIVESTFCDEIIPWLSTMFDRSGAPAGGDWLLLGPTGPHIVGHSIGVLTRYRGSRCHFVDLDSRWVKRCIRDGDLATVGRYVDHIVDQAADLITTQRLSVLVSTPPILEAICRRPELVARAAEQLRAVIWAGTSATPETLRVLAEEIFVNASLVGLYGNTMGGVAPQRPRRPGDADPCVFQPYRPSCLVDIVDPADPDRLVGYGERGRVRASVLCRDHLILNVMERDTAIRVAPSVEYPWDGLADVAPLATADAPQAVEGVY